MGCRSINVLRLGLRMFSMNLSLSHATRELERPNNQDGIVAGVCQYLYAGAVLSFWLVHIRQPHQFKPDKTTELNRI